MATMKAGETKLLGETLEYTLSLAANKYGEVRSLYPSVCEGVEHRLESFAWISGPLIENAKRAKPLIERLDDKLAPVVAQFQEKAALASQQKDSLLKNAHDQKDTLIKTVQDQRETIFKAVQERVDPLYKNVQERVDPLYKNVQERVDTNVTSLKTKWGLASKSTVERLEKSFQNVQTFTSEKSMQYIHVDLIEYSKNVLEQGKPAVQSIFDRFGSIMSAETTNDSETEVLAKKDDSRSVKLHHLLQDAIERARGLSTVAMQVPGYAYSAVSHSPEFANKVKDEVTRNYDNESYQGTLGTIGLLLDSVRTVVGQSITVEVPREAPEVPEAVSN